MKSVRLTLDWGGEKQYVIDCLAEGFQRLTVSFQEGNGGDGRGDTPVREADRSPDSQPDRVHPVEMPQGAGAFEVGNRCNFNTQYAGARTALGLHSFPQGYQTTI